MGRRWEIVTPIVFFGAPPFKRAHSGPGSNCLDAEPLCYIQLCKRPRLHTNTRQATWEELILQREPIFLSLAPRGRMNSLGERKKSFPENRFTHIGEWFIGPKTTFPTTAHSLYISSSSKNVRANIAVVSLCWRSVNRRDGSIAFPTPCKAIPFRLGLLSVKKKKNISPRVNWKRKRNG